MQDILTKAARIRLVIFDVDGVLTDGSLFLGDDGQEYKAFNSRDGHGMKLQSNGVTIAIITGRSSQVVSHRMASLGVEHVYQGAHDKALAYAELCGKLSLDDSQVAYVGDDVVDLLAESFRRIIIIRPLEPAPGVDRVRACDLQDFLDARTTVVYHAASVKRFDSHVAVH